MGDRLITAIFIICAVMGALLLAMILAPDVPGAGGVAHPEIPAMQIGGDGANRLQFIGLYAFVFQALLLLLIICLCCLGVSKRYRTSTFYGYMAACYAFMILVWWQMFSGHQAYLDTSQTTYFMGFPVATAWQMYGTWLCAIPLILIYTLGFNRYIYTAEDKAAFDALLKAKLADSE